MTDQPFQPNVPLQPPAGPGAPASFPIVERENGGRFEVRPDSMILHAEPGLYVTGQFYDGRGDAPFQVPCRQVGFSASARTLLDEDGWALGWIQTVLPSSSWVVYRPPQDDGTRTKLVTTLATAKRDGLKKTIWYDDPTALTRNEWADAAMDDDPNIGVWHPNDPNELHPELPNWIPLTCGGTKEFWSWLVAHKKTTNELVFLHHVHWAIRYDGRFTPDFGIEAAEGTGARILAQGPGRGTQTPCYDKKEVGPEDETRALEHL